jgi:hypothetical protein
MRYDSTRKEPPLTGSYSALKCFAPCVLRRDRGRLRNCYHNRFSTAVRHACNQPRAAGPQNNDPHPLPTHEFGRVRATGKIDQR